MKKLILLSLLFFTSCHQESQNNQNRLSLNVREIKLENGFKALLVKREGAPVFSAYLRIKVGNIEEPKGATGLAHFFEHMAFKGTPKIGVKDYEAEKILLEKIHHLGSEIVRYRHLEKPKEEIKRLKEELKLLQEEHQKLIEPNEFVKIFQRNGGSDLNATTSSDFTSYFVSLPSNKLSLWAYLESERLIHPVYREFYKERDVVAEERRMRYDNVPDGRLYEAFVNAGFQESPYKNNVIGSPEDISNYTLDKAKNFRETYYIPSRMVLGLVGNFDVDKAEKIIRKYFGQLQSKKDKPFKPKDEKMGEPYFPKQVIIKGNDEPRLYFGYHRPAYPHRDDEVFDAIESLLCEGRTSRLYSRLVLQKKVAVSIGCSSSVPGSRLDGMFTFYAIPLKPFSNSQVKDEIIQVLNEMKTTKVLDEELEKIKKSIDADLIWALKSNMGLASMLTFYDSLSGNWEYIYDIQEKIHAINAERVKQVMNEYFVSDREVTTFLEKEI